MSELYFLWDWYDWLKALHVISVIAWMAGMLYLPRLFVYHCGVVSGSEQSETFKIMERRLLKAITTPAMFASWFFGILMLAAPGAVPADEYWMWLKLGMLVLLEIFYFMLTNWQQQWRLHWKEPEDKYHIPRLR
ncbi:MAG TPA: CopD family protein, partial [Sneathiellales bacterium]|nr:CopD family protein [Sneathiellales bacterium]